MEKYLIVDMDGTFVDFYGVENWKHYLDDLQDVTPYRIAKPVYNMRVFNKTLRELRKAGWKIVICSWLSRVNVREGFHQEIMKEKSQWLMRHRVPCDEVIYLEYGVNKEEAVSHLKGIKILVDDSDTVLDDWSGLKIDAKQNILPLLNQLIPQYLYTE